VVSGEDRFGDIGDELLGWAEYCGFCAGCARKTTYTGHASPSLEEVNMSIDSSLRAHAVSLVPICFSACFSGLLACGGLADPEGAEADGEATETRVQQLSAGGLSITGSSTLQPLTARDGYANLFDGNFNLTNNTNRTVSINKQLFFFAAPGGYAYADPSFDIWWGPLPAGATAQVGGLGR
jgi:hypothetical protein